MVSSITHLPDTIQHCVHNNINRLTIDTNGNAFGYSIAHPETGYRSFTCAVTHNEANTYINYDNTMNTIWMRARKGCMDNVMIGACDRSSTSNGIVTIQRDATIQSSRMDHEIELPVNKWMHGNNMKICYLFQFTKLFMHGTRMVREYVMKRENLIVDLCLGTRILIYWMTKANRRGVTCTGDSWRCTDLFGIFSYSYLLGSPLFERELENRIT